MATRPHMLFNMIMIDFENRGIVRQWTRRIPLGVGGIKLEVNGQLSLVKRLHSHDGNDNFE